MELVEALFLLVLVDSKQHSQMCPCSDHPDHRLGPSEDDRAAEGSQSLLHWPSWEVAMEVARASIQALVGQEALGRLLP